MSSPPSLLRLVQELERMPGIGRRSAERLAHHLLRVPEAQALALADAVRDARRSIRPCSLCQAPAESEPCPICRDPGRDRAVLMVVETARDLAAVEAAGGYRGLYYVLGGRLSPLEGVTAQDLALEGLTRRISDGDVNEICIATNPDLEGDGTALIVQRTLAETDKRITRLARGLPAGGQIEYLSAAVLAEAFEGRQGLERSPREERRRRMRPPPPA